MASHRNAQARERWRSKVVGIFLKLATGLAEAHEKGLRYLNVHPADIRFDGDEPRMYPIDFSTWQRCLQHHPRAKRALQK